jgi:opacity protein-like surface antigen
MKNLLVFFMLLLSAVLHAQDSEVMPMFSKYYFGVMGGTNFNTLPTAGTALNFEIKSNITSNIYAKISIGYSTLYDDNPYEVRSYRFVSIDDYTEYQTILRKVDRIRYSIIPISAGIEYLITKSKVSPFVLLEGGYNYSSSLTEGVTIAGIAGYYDTVEEIPEDYRKTAPSLDDGSSITAAIGLGVKYMLTERMDLNIRYVYHYNETIINNNQVLIGLTF